MPEALPRIMRDLREARSRFYLTGWFFSPGFDLIRDLSPSPLRELLAEVAKGADARLLAWARPTSTTAPSSTTRKSIL
jgi:hypothetical protein